MGHVLDEIHVVQVEVAKLAALVMDSLYELGELVEQ